MDPSAQDALAADNEILVEGRERLEEALGVGERVASRRSSPRASRTESNIVLVCRSTPA
jgi:hypothetical protein